MEQNNNTNVILFTAEMVVEKISTFRDVINIPPILTV
jgi:hypothetical protein